MNNKRTKQGFTLIELLVVVLIIGILAAVALPQYQKAVWKSRNAELKQIIKAVAAAEEVYYLANGKYAADFNELDIDLPLTPVATTKGGHTGVCGTSTQGTDSSRQANDYYVVLNSEDSTMQQAGVVAYWSSGSVYFTGPSNVGDLEMPGNCDTANSVYCYTSVGGFMVMCNSSRCRVAFMPSFNADGTSGNKALPGETTFTLEYTRADGWYISGGASTPAVEICEWIDSHAEYKVKSTVKTRCANVGRTLSNQEAS